MDELKNNSTFLPSRHNIKIHLFYRLLKNAREWKELEYVPFRKDSRICAHINYKVTINTGQLNMGAWYSTNSMCASNVMSLLLRDKH